MTEYRLVPAEATEEMMEAARPWPTHWGDLEFASNEQKAAYLADHMTLASDYRAMLQAAPPAPTREEVARVIAHATGDAFDDAFASKAEWNAAGGYKGDRFRQISEPMQGDYLDAADAILALLASPTTKD